MKEKKKKEFPTNIDIMSGLMTSPSLQPSILLIRENPCTELWPSQLLFIISTYNIIPSAPAMLRESKEQSENILFRPSKCSRRR